VRRIARSKAAAVSGSLVLAADTAVAAGRRILPKAETEAQARACLSLLSGRRHRVYTAVVVAEASGEIRERLVDSVVTSRG
jgi:septum formation protein